MPPLTVEYGQPPAEQAAVLVRQLVDDVAEGPCLLSGSAGAGAGAGGGGSNAPARCALSRILLGLPIFKPAQ